jgi:DNA polymerase-3 subunit gamma/tau
LIDPASYSGIWEKVLSYFKAIHRVEIYTCYRKGTLIYANNARAVITAPQQFLVIMGNNKSYQTIAAEAFQKIVPDAPSCRS